MPPVVGCASSAAFHRVRAYHRPSSGARLPPPVFGCASSAACRRVRVFRRLSSGARLPPPVFECVSSAACLRVRNIAACNRVPVFRYPSTCALHRCPFFGRATSLLRHRSRVFHRLSSGARLQPHVIEGATRCPFIGCASWLPVLWVRYFAARSSDALLHCLLYVGAIPVYSHRVCNNKVHYHYKNIYLIRTEQSK
ncbi:hypothetical protein evm_007884 [Chilo suppressalis]|nr:hypothetical protein evm_007884 [Chilo suppressalis]